MRIFGNFGTIRVGVFVIINPLADWYWNGRWTIDYLRANGTWTKYIKV